MDRGYQVAPQPDTSLQHVTSQFHDALRIGSTSIQHNNEKVNPSVPSSLYYLVIAYVVQDLFNLSYTSFGPGSK